MSVVIEQNRPFFFDNIHLHHGVDVYENSKIDFVLAQQILESSLSPNTSVAFLIEGPHQESESDLAVHLATNYGVLPLDSLIGAERICSEDKDVNIEEHDETDLANDRSRYLARLPYAEHLRLSMFDTLGEKYPGRVIPLLEKVGNNGQYILDLVHKRREYTEIIHSLSGRDQHKAPEVITNFLQGTIQRAYRRSKQISQQLINEAEKLEVTVIARFFTLEGIVASEMVARKLKSYGDENPLKIIKVAKNMLNGVAVPDSELVSSMREYLGQVRLDEGIK